jgi:nucleotide-binding universal stress UspA family protein
MYRHLLIATDGSELAEKAVAQGLLLAKKLNAKVTVVTVTEPLTPIVGGEAVYPTMIVEYEKAIELSAKKILAPAREAAAKNGLACDALHVKDQYPADGIIETAKANGCDLIVMASHGRRGLARVLMGSQTIKVVTHSSIPVLVCR